MRKRQEVMSAIILAGGSSKRMKTNKAFLQIEEKELIQIILDKLSLVFGEFIIVTNSPQEYKHLKAYIHNAYIKIVRDKISNCGPLGGIYSGLIASGHFYNFVTACDMPFINLELISYMNELANRPYYAVVPRIDKRIEPLCAFYSKDCIKPINRRLTQGGHRLCVGQSKLSIISFLRDIRVRYVAEKEIGEFDPEYRSFFNVNNSKDYQLALRLSQMARYENNNQIVKFYLTRLDRYVKK